MTATVWLISTKIFVQVVIHNVSHALTLLSVLQDPIPLMTATVSLISTNQIHHVYHALIVVLVLQGRPLSMTVTVWLISTNRIHRVYHALVVLLVWLEQQMLVHVRSTTAMSVRLVQIISAHTRSQQVAIKVQ